MRSRVAAEIGRFPLSAWDTVLLLTCALAATSAMVTRATMFTYFVISEGLTIKSVCLYCNQTGLIVKGVLQNR